MSTRRPRMSAVSILLRVGAYGAFLCIASLSLLYVGYRVKRPAVSVEEPAIDPAHSHVLSGEILRRLGSLQVDDREGRFLGFPLAKAAGKVRVGCFGDSFTYGDEVGSGEDYPSLLADMLAEQGFPQYEVLNFGSSWHGAHQAYMVWDEIGRRYDLDYVLLGPTIFRPDRDFRFNHTNGVNQAYVHSRYILDEAGGIKRVDIPGESRREVVESYRAFIPPWNALRFDVSAPASVLAFLPPGRTLANPFYYRKDGAGREWKSIFRAMLASIERSGAEVVIGDATVWTFSERGFRYEQALTFPYLRPRGHNSSLGNRAVAAQFFEQLTGRAVESARYRPVAPRWSGSPDPRPNRPLLAFDRAGLKIGDEDVGAFFDLSREAPGEGQVFRELAAEAAVAFTNGDATPPLEAVWIPLRAAVRDGDDVAVVTRIRGVLTRRRLGTVRLLHPNVPLGVVETPWVRSDAQAYHAEKRAAFALEDIAGAARVPGDDSVEGIFVGDRKVIDVEVQDDGGGRGRVVVPSEGPYLAARAVPSRLDPERWGSRPVVDLVLASGTDEMRIAFGALEREKPSETSRAKSPPSAEHPGRKATRHVR